MLAADVLHSQKFTQLGGQTHEMPTTTHETLPSNPVDPAMVPPRRHAWSHARFVYMRQNIQALSALGGYQCYKCYCCLQLLFY
jgi:hypothetical protein